MEDGHQSIVRQWKSRSLLLLDHFCKEKAVPVAPGPSILHSGRIQQLSGKGLLQSGSWKKRYCVLDGQRLFFYNNQQESSSDPSRSWKEKTGHYIDLRCYDICEEAAGSIIKDVQRSRSGSSSSVSSSGSSQQQHVWVISSADIEKGSHRFFETGGRVYLSAGSLTEMNEWISQIRSAMTALRSGAGVTRQPIQQRNSVKRIDSAQKANQGDVNKDSGTDMMIDYVGDNKTLDCGVVKQRAKGPTGRRLPRQQSRVFPGTLMAGEARSESLSRLEDRQLPSTSSNQRQKDLVRREQHNRSFDFGRPNRSGQLDRSTVYAYSSDEDEQSVMNISFIPATGETDEEMAVIETLCSDDVTGTGLHHAISTPALTSGGPSLTSTAFHSMPRRPKRRIQQPIESSSSQGVLQQPSSSSTDDDPPMQQAIWRQDQQLQLMKEAATVRAALAGLEADLGASRRDVGWLQENLSTVQNAAGQVADKVAKMQSTVANMERQISGAVKEAQLMQQRANEALQSASEAERDYRRLEGDCRDLLIQLRRAHRQQTSEALSISPMTPHGLMIQQPKATDIYSNNGGGFQQNAFDYSSILSSGGATIKPVKSSLRCSSESRNFSDRSSINKSISFGPTTTFATSPMSDPEDTLPGPAATSTLKKSAMTGNNHFLIFNQNSSNSITPAAAIITP